MTMVAVPGGLWIPNPVSSDAAAPDSKNAVTLSFTTWKGAFVFRAPKSGTLDSFEFQVSDPGANYTLKCGFQDRNSSGSPDDTYDQWASVNIISGSSWIAPGTMTSDGTGVTGTKRSVTAGDWVACVVEITAGTSPTFSLKGLQFSAATTQGPHQAYYLRFVPTNWQETIGAMPLVVLKYDDGSYVSPHFPIVPASATRSVTFNNTSTPDELALRFQVPFTGTLVGMWARFAPPLSGTGVDVVLYDAASSAIGTPTRWTGVGFGSSSGVTRYIPLLAPQAITADTTYRLALKPTDANNMTWYDFDVPSASYMAAVDGGAEWYYSERTDAGSWTDTTTRRPWIGLRFSEIDDGAGGGGGETAHVFIG